MARAAAAAPFGPRPAPRAGLPELLAPAGRPEAMVAALEAGADAVYVGTRDFNARLRAPNFTLDELARLTRYAHGMGRRVYVTCNTLLQEAELPGLVATLDALRRIGPDALIIQDLGVYRLARRLAPEIALHASTQMTVHSLDGALEAQRLGFQRVILARELTLDEIRAIRAGCSIELETFVHGALCYSISGQCLFSSAVHGASANRGRCMQPCRRFFETAGADPEAAFSMLDLAAAPILPQLVAAGIRSFKIEGRLKPAETVAQIVAAYRLLLDAHPRITREVVAEARERLDRAVGRESSPGFYLSARPERILGSGEEAQSGRRVGQALAGSHGWMRLAAIDTVKKGDRLRVAVSPQQAPRAFVVREIRREGQTVNRAYPGQEVRIAVPFSVPEGATVVKTADAEATPRGAVRHVERVRTEAMAGRPARAAFAARLAHGGGGTLALEVPVGSDRVALSVPEGADESLPLARALAILSEESETLDVRLDAAFAGEPQAQGRGGLAAAANETVFVSPQALAGLREKALQRVARLLARQRDELLAEEVSSSSAPRSGSREEASAVHPVETLIRVDTLAQAEEVLTLLPPAGSDGSGAPPICADLEVRAIQAGATALVLPLAEVEADGFRSFLERPGLRSALVLALPTFLFEPERRATVQAQLRRALDLGIRRFEASNLGHFHLLRATGRRGLWVLTGPALGCLNSASHAQLLELGADVVTYSVEGGRENLARLAARGDPVRVALRVYGAVPLFQSRAAGPRARASRWRLREPQTDLRIERRDGITHVLASEPHDLTRDWPRAAAALGLRCRIVDLAFEPHPGSAPVLRSLAGSGAPPAARPASRFRHFRDELE